MQYNIHPIIVHFPIAFLFIYAVIKILPFRKWFPKVSWNDISLIVLIVGVLGAFASLSTGEAAEHVVRRNRQLVEAHSMFASLSTWLFGALLVGELAAIFNRTAKFMDQKWAMVRKVTVLLQKYLYDSFLAAFIVVIAFLSIMMTGLLGGVIVYGTTADPIAGFVLQLLGITI